jgi:hypothetical protein
MERVEENLLWRLNAMCNLDKQRRIPANGSEVFSKLPSADPKLVSFETFENQGIFSVPWGHRDQLDLHPNVSFQVVFGDVASRVALGPNGIRDIYEFISTRLLPRFIRFFT